MAERLLYDGQRLFWFPVGVGPPMSYRATSGLPGFQTPANQCIQDAGPVPEGQYVLILRIDPRDFARDNGAGQCALAPAWNIQRIPRGGPAMLPPSASAANACEPFWANWGENRVRIEPADAATRRQCGASRSGFYLHDSTKGYSHGCIEVEPAFFQDLRRRVNPSRADRLSLTVRYAHTSTNGGTLRASPGAAP